MRAFATFAADGQHANDLVGLGLTLNPALMLQCTMRASSVAALLRHPAMTRCPPLPLWLVPEPAGVCGGICRQRSQLFGQTTGLALSSHLVIALFATFCPSHFVHVPLRVQGLELLRAVRDAAGQLGKQRQLLPPDRPVPVLQQAVRHDACQLERLHVAAQPVRSPPCLRTSFLPPVCELDRHPKNAWLCYACVPPPCDRICRLLLLQVFNAAHPPLPHLFTSCAHHQSRQAPTWEASLCVKVAEAGKLPAVRRHPVRPGLHHLRQQRLLRTHQPHLP